MLAVSGAALVVIGRGATLGGSLIRLVKRFERKYSILRPRTGGIPPRISRRWPLGICISSCGIISARRWSDSDMLRLESRPWIVRLFDLTFIEQYDRNIVLLGIHLSHRVYSCGLWLHE